MALTTPQDVINRARSLAYVSVGQYSDSLALEDYNLARASLSNFIMSSVNENYFAVTMVTSIIEGQNKYSLTDDTNDVDVNKIGEVIVDNIKAISKEESEINGETYAGAPVYYISGDYVYIYPTPTADIAGGLKMKASLTPIDLAIDEADTFFPVEYRTVIALGMLVDIYKRRGLLNEASFAFTSFENAKSEMVAALTDRIDTPAIGILPDLSYFE